MIHIIFFSPYKELSTVIEQVFSERPDKNEITYEVILDSFNNTLEFGIHGDVIISRGFTASALKKTDIPNAELKTSGYDVITAVDRCLSKHPYRRIAVVGAFNMVYGSESMNNVYRNVTITSYSTEKEIHLRDIVKQAIEEGAQVIVGGCSTVAIAKEYNIPTELIESGKEAINNAIDEAIRTVLITRKEKRKSNEIANILNYSFQGIISTDKKGFITLANNYCMSILAKNAVTIVGEKVIKYFPNIPLEEVIEADKKILSEIYRINDMMLMVNCVPIKGKGENVGSVVTFQDVTKIQEEEGKIRKNIYKKGFVAKYSFGNIIYKDKMMQETIRIAKRFSDSDSNLLIFGETGTGKELFAQSIHNDSRRRNGPFVAINCAALPDELLESELFGYVEGAFTGAARGGKVGLFEIAHKGTIFLDEIGDISPKLQGRLLRVLQEREIIRLGHDRIIPIDVRVISATNKNLHEEVKKGNFRQDLLYRLDVLKLSVFPIRERKEDIVHLINYYITAEREKTGCILKGLDKEAQAMAVSHNWMGNVRELRNFCERICVLCENEYASAWDVTNALGIYHDGDTEMIKIKASDPKPVDSVSDILQETEKEIILAALKSHNYNRKQTAESLNIDKSTLWRKIKKYQINIG
ncbi:sigma 54-interacting transcriptional regulator [Petroclostridium sp. X23]|uniref:sigma 54-interacting transcriptional regulator n=1 Tax=Petroclostridium sp. X23 TaxID=3045146 RepID=UPI0024ADB527|nr:sigma 54-interacting transcriptional regulator [Petroclostridium sp. X23]WHH60360.1 sigma 54-interacting transcriptional regulator [Petroclostridium sp. X23]